MPQVVAPLIAGASAIASVFGMSAGGLAIGLLSTGAEIGLSLYQRSRLKQSDAPRQELTDNFAQDVPVFYQGYGLYKIGGQYLWRDYADNAFYLAVIVSGDVIDGIQAFYINGTEVLIDANGYVTTPPFNTLSGHLVQFEVKYGYTSQSRSGLLNYGFPSIITAQHTGAGVAYVVARVVKDTDENFQRVFGSQIPSLTMLVRGALVYDPRDPLQIPSNFDTWAYTTNPALNTLAFCSSPTGYGLSRSIFAADTFSAVADLCDGLITTKTKGLRKRYEMGGVVFSDEPAGNTLDAMLQTFSGRFYLTTNGLIGLSCDELEVPIITLTEANVIDIDFGFTVGALFDCTTVRSRFTSEDHGYTRLGEEADPYNNAAALARVGREDPVDFPLPMVFRHDQARRLMKKRWYDLNPDWSPNVTFNSDAVELFGERVFRFSFGIPDGDGGRTVLFDQTFRLLSVNEDEDEGLAKIHVRCVSIAPEASQFDPVTEEGTAPALPPDTSSGVVPQTPTGLYVRVGDVSAGAGTGVRAIAAWNSSTTGHAQEAQFKLSTDTVWTDCPVAAADRAFAVPLSGFLTAAANYDFRVRVTDTLYPPSAWASITFAANYVAGATSALQNFVAVDGVLRIVASVTQANAVTAGFVEFLALAHGSANPGAGAWTGSIFRAATQNQTLNIDVAKAAGAYDLYCRSIGANGDRGAVSSQLNLTVTETLSTGGSAGSGSGGGGGNGSGGSNGGSTGDFGSSSGGGIYGIGNTPGQVGSGSLYGGSDGGDGGGSGGLY